jgi:alkylhydroperoxidase/carboxymuconolactone decarboxylase family protein YurZ
MKLPDTPKRGGGAARELEEASALDKKTEELAYVAVLVACRCMRS